MNQTFKNSNLIRCLTLSSFNSRCFLNGNLQKLTNQQFKNEQFKNDQFNNYQQKRSITRGRVNVLKEMKIRAKNFDLMPHKLRHRREWLDWNYDCELYAFNQRLNEKFDEITLKRAFIFKTYYETIQYSFQSVNQSENQSETNDENEKIDGEENHNEQFIKSGFELCDQFISSYLRYFLKNIPEEGISAIKKYLLSNERLADMATKIGCKDLILCNEFPVETDTLAKTMLSIIGALKHDTDDKHATKFIIDFIMTYLYSIDIIDIWEILDPEKHVKTILNTNGIKDFEYRLLRATGTNTIIPTYLIGVYCNKKLLGFGSGISIDEAKEMAAYDCLRRMFNLNAANMVYKFGEAAYDLDYQKFSEPYQSIDNFKIEFLDRFK